MCTHFIIALPGRMVWLFPILWCGAFIWTLLGLGACRRCTTVHACVTACVRSLPFSNCMHFARNNKQPKRQRQQHRDMGTLGIGHKRHSTHVRLSLHAVWRRIYVRTMCDANERNIIIIITDCRQTYSHNYIWNGRCWVVVDKMGEWVCCGGHDSAPLTQMWTFAFPQLFIIS